MKTITISESAQDKIKSSDVTHIADQVKSKTGAIGTTGKLSHSLFYKIVSNGFFIF